MVAPTSVAVALVLCYLLARERFGRATSLLAVAGVGLGSPVLWLLAGPAAPSGFAAARGGGARGLCVGPERAGRGDPGVGPRGRRHGGRIPGGDAVDGRPDRRRLRPRRRALVVARRAAGDVAGGLRGRARLRRAVARRPRHRRGRPDSAGGDRRDHVVRVGMVVGGVAVARRLPRAHALRRLRCRRVRRCVSAVRQPPPRARGRSAGERARRLERHAHEGGAGSPVRARRSRLVRGSRGGAGPGAARLDWPPRLGAGERRLRRRQRRAARRLRHPVRPTGCWPAATRRGGSTSAPATGLSSARAGTRRSRTAARRSDGRPAMALVDVPLDHAADLVVQVDARPYQPPKAPPQQLTLVVNGVPHGPVTLAPGWHPAVVTVSRASLAQWREPPRAALRLRRPSVRCGHPRRPRTFGFDRRDRRPRRAVAGTSRQAGHQRPRRGRPRPVPNGHLFGTSAPRRSSK